MNFDKKQVGCGLDWQQEPDCSAWFSTPGDADDFIFYGDEDNLPSEK